MLTEDTQLTDMDSAVSSRPQDNTDHTGDQDQDRSQTKTEGTSEEPLFFIDKEATSLPVSENHSRAAFWFVLIITNSDSRWLNLALEKL